MHFVFGGTFCHNFSQSLNNSYCRPILLDAALFSLFSWCFCCPACECSYFTGGFAIHLMFVFVFVFV